jgi:hypothetical protein
VDATEKATRFAKQMHGMTVMSASQSEVDVPAVSWDDLTESERALRVEVVDKMVRSGWMLYGRKVVLEDTRDAMMHRAQREQPPGGLTFEPGDFSEQA